ncbi:hypothetical protein HMPREF1531_00980 [Propionibacterium sp. oral taxon 192 str. F0372]|uniref:alpha/beta fold hydrolase n=1 Tax=Propionibacterium sp. oral taxon 192 TaxID=671222 RepID=UPI0003533942|nr:alpha/beta fold hydrolase [Propionibacterium sp. oral taxon 192]EPH05551.1 hypothetical protein HMPREF1531_00980 [Propionibacterium sp. oral taxon 192 str. F0372]
MSSWPSARVREFAERETFKLLVPRVRDDRPANVNDDFVSTDGGQLAVRCYPAAGRIAFVVIHGLLHTQDDIRASAQRLAASGWPVVTYDLRGHGNSTAELTTSGMVNQHIVDLGCVMDKLGELIPTARRAIPVGQSFSAWTVLAYAGGPGREKVAGVVCDSGPAPSAPEHIGWLVASSARGSNDDELRESFAEVLELATCHAASALRQEAAWPPGPLRSGVPGLFLSGSRDRVIPASAVAQVADTVPGSRHIIFDKATHCRLFSAAPERYLTLLSTMAKEADSNA